MKITDLISFIFIFMLSAQGICQNVQQNLNADLGAKINFSSAPTSSQNTHFIDMFQSQLNGQNYSVKATQKQIINNQQIENALKQNENLPADQKIELWRSKLQDGGMDSGGGNVCWINDKPYLLELTNNVGVLTIPGEREDLKYIKPLGMRPVILYTDRLKDYIDAQLARYEKTSPVFIGALKEIMKQQATYFTIAKIGIPIHADVTSLPNCQKQNVQAAILYNHIGAKIIDVYIWNQLDLTSQAALLVHEALRSIQIRLSQSIVHKYTMSDQELQNLTAYLFSNSAPQNFDFLPFMKSMYLSWSVSFGLNSNICKILGLSPRHAVDTSDITQTSSLKDALPIPLSQCTYQLMQYACLPDDPQIGLILRALNALESDLNQLKNKKIDKKLLLQLQNEIASSKVKLDENLKDITITNAAETSKDIGMMSSSYEAGIMSLTLTISIGFCLPEVVEGSPKLEKACKDLSQQFDLLMRIGFLKQYQ